MAQIKDEQNLSQVEWADRIKDPVWGGQRLAQISIFSKFSKDELEELYKTGEVKKFGSSSHVVIEGENTRGLFILLKGTVSVYKTDTSTNTLYRLTYLEEGSNFGEMSLFDNAPRSATVSCENECYLFELDTDVFMKFLETKGLDLKCRFYQTCAEELVSRFRQLNTDYLQSQKLLWRHALRLPSEESNVEPTKKK